MTWAAVAGVAGGLIGNMMNSPTGTSGGGANMYTPTGLSGADQGWQGNFGANQSQLGYSGGPIAYGGLWGNQQSFNPGQNMGQPTMGIPEQQQQQQQMQQYGGGGGQGLQYGPGGQYDQLGPSNTGNPWPTGATSMQGNTPYGGGGQSYFGGGSGGSSGGYGSMGGGLAGAVDPLMYASLQQQQGIDYNPYLNASQQAGQQYGNLANMSGQAGAIQTGQAMQNFGQEANLQNTGQNYFNQQQALGQPLGAAGMQQYGQMQGLGNQALGAGYQQNQQQQGLAQGLQGAGQQVYNTAFDPQLKLYNQEAQQTMDQANATNSMYGLGSSGAGAGIANQAMNQFNLGWQNQQLGRETAGMNAMAGANQAASGISNTGYGALSGGIGQAGGLNTQGMASLTGGLQGQSGIGYQGAQGMTAMNQAATQQGALGGANMQQGMGYYGQQPGYTQQSAQVPMNAQQYVAGMPAQNASQYASNMLGAMAPYNSQMSQAIPYMNYGAGAGNAAMQNTLKSNAANQQSIGSLASGLGQVNWGQLGNAFGGGGANQGYGGYGTTPTSSDLQSIYGNVGYGT